jgi:hypothetical protein
LKILKDELSQQSIVCTKMQEGGKSIFITFNLGLQAIKRPPDKSISLAAYD